MSTPNPGQPSAPTPNAGQLIQPQMLNSLKFLDNQMKAKYQSAIQQCWSVIKSRPQGSDEHRHALQQLKGITDRLKQQHQQYNKQQQQTGAAGQAVAAGSSQAQAPATPAPTAQTQPGMAQQQSAAATQNTGAPAAASTSTAPAGQAPGAAQVSQKIVQHVKEFPFIQPPDKPLGTPEGEQWLSDMRKTYLNILLQMDKLQTELRKIETFIAGRKAQGQDVPAEVMERKKNCEQQHAATKANADKLRSQHQQGMVRQQQQKNLAQQGGAAGQAKPEQAGGQAAAQMPGVVNKQFNLQMPKQQATQSPVVGQAPGSVAANAAGDTQLAMSPGGQIPQQMSQQMGHQGSFPGQQQAAQNSQNNPMMLQNSNMQAQRPALNTQQNIQSSPQVPQSAGPGGIPAPLSHRDAVARAARGYSDQQPRMQLTPGGHQYQPQVGTRERQNTNANMPIPKTMTPSVPVPVNMGMSRPTLAGPSNGVGGMLGQPVIEKHGSVLVEGDGTGVLSRDKLQELVREVGGPDETLTPEVEDIMLNVADEFIDNVITAACRVAKLRDGAELQLRDIQTVLERNYNIRIPGYSLDETRVVRKFQPAPGWHQKMAAINAAKVVSGKGDL